MSLLKPKSLRWRLVMRITIAQTAMLALLIAANFVIFGALWRYGYLNEGAYERTTAEAVGRAVRRGEDGKLVVGDTPELRTLRSEIPDLWYVLRGATGQEIREGAVPADVETALSALDAIAYADLGQDIEKSSLPIATVQWAPTLAGPVKIMSGTQGQVTVEQIRRTTQMPLVLMVVLTITMTLATLLVTPIVVRRAMRGLDVAADEARSIDIQRSGTRLSTESVPQEVLPFVTAVNDALLRLDMGYEGHKRFLTDAAHELRTPIAILATRLSALPSGDLKGRLLEDVSRLTNLTGQLLDLQRLNQQELVPKQVDLVMLAERVVLDLAPLAFAAGYEMNFEPDTGEAVVRGDPTSIERALTNIVQNAINYGGRKGTITVRVTAAPAIEVDDEGAGVPEAEREQIFEPFHRLKQDGRGVGLGLDLVQKIMAIHEGSIDLIEREGRGARFRLTFPPPGPCSSLS